MESAAAFDYLGGDKVLGHTIASVLELNDLINARFPAQALKDRFQLTHGEFARALGVSEKTVERGVSRGPIRLATSDRLYRLARLIGLATEVLADETQGIDWLRSPQYGLGDRVPLSLISTDPGSEEVQAELLRIRFGFLA
jgi:putative toxin-antitoxin system antitoxin component (TIGR02293 family)